MRDLIYILVLFTSLNCFAQFNLVPNNSFENYSSCPSSTNQTSLCIGWINPTTASPDYYNSCSTIISVPYCGGTPCFQYAKTGNAYVGLYGFSKSVSDVREYVQSQLISTLAVNKCYYIGFYLNNANWTGVGCNNLAVYLSNNAISLPGPTYLLNYTPQIKGFGNKIITDTLNWHIIAGIFQSSGNENFLTIGNFNNDSSTDTSTFNSTVIGADHAYYYIDDVFVIPIDSVPSGMPAFAGNNVTINSGDSTFIGQQISNLNCNWYNGTVQIATNTSGLYVKPVTTTTYVVQQNLCGNITNDTVVVTVGGLGIKDAVPIAIGIRISPNPNSGIFTMEILSKEFRIENAELRITNLLGQELKSEKHINKKQTLDITELNSGIYFLQLIQNETILVTNKIIITK